MENNHEDVLAPLKDDPDHFLRLAYKTSYSAWLKLHKLTASPENWERYKATRRHRPRPRFGNQ